MLRNYIEDDECNQFDFTCETKDYDYTFKSVLELSSVSYPVFDIVDALKHEYSYNCENDENIASIKKLNTMKRRKALFKASKDPILNRSLPSSDEIIIQRPSTLTDLTNMHSDASDHEWSLSLCSDVVNEVDTMNSDDHSSDVNFVDDQPATRVRFFISDDDDDDDEEVEKEESEEEMKEVVNVATTSKLQMNVPRSHKMRMRHHKHFDHNNHHRSRKLFTQFNRLNQLRSLAIKFVSKFTSHYYCEYLPAATRFNVHSEMTENIVSRIVGALFTVPHTQRSADSVRRHRRGQGSPRVVLCNPEYSERFLARQMCRLVRLLIPKCPSHTNNVFLLLRHAIASS